MAQSIRPAFVYQSNINRMVAHAGFTKGYFEFYKEGKVSRPVSAYSISGGTIALSSMARWTEEAIDEYIDILRNLTPGQIFTLDRWLKAALVVEVADSLAMLLNNKPIKTFKDLMFLLAKPAISFAVKAMLLNGILHIESILDHKPLVELLSSRLKKEDGLKDIFDSPIKINIGAVNIRTGELERFTNYRKEDLGNADKLFAGIVGSATLPGYFPLARYAGQKYVDGALVCSAPIHWAREDDCHPIWLLSYTGLDQTPKEGKYDSWFEVLYRSLEIAITEHTKAVVERCQEINNDLRLARERGIDTAGFSFHGKKEVDIIVVESEYPLPDLDLRSIRSDTILELIDIGYATARRVIKDRLERGLPM